MNRPATAAPANCCPAPPGRTACPFRPCAAAIAPAPWNSEPNACTAVSVADPPSQPHKDTRMTQPTVLITGCSSGIGRALADAFKQAGYQVWATARKEADLA